MNDGVIDARRIRYEPGAGGQRAQADRVSVEEPLEISLAWRDAAGAGREAVFTVTMRTPGDDEALALGLLHAEGILRAPQDVAALERPRGEGDAHNRLLLRLAPGLQPELGRYQRHLPTHSSCGVCGKTSLQALELADPPALDADSHWLDPQILPLLGERLRAAQAQFRETGGAHAVGLFGEGGELLLAREDVGRHNAMDKVVGAWRYRGAAPAAARAIAVLSGRSSFELVQKAVMAAIPVVVSVGAPSSLAIDAATRFGLTLVGFASAQGFSVYTGPQRLGKASG